MPRRTQRWRLTAPDRYTWRRRSFRHQNEPKRGESHEPSSVDAYAAAVVPFLLYAAAATAAKTEIKGAAILDNPCGKASVKQMGLVHAGNMEEANKLTTAKCRISGKRCRRRIAP
jgi:hypothetical protein